MQPKYNRAAIMRRAHSIRRETGIAFGPAMSLAWQEAKQAPEPPRYVPVPIPPQRLPLEAFVLGAAGIVRKIVRSKIEIGLRVNITGGIRVTDSQGHSQAIGRDFSAGGIYTRDGRPRAIAIEYRP